jgi:hypothetical protein
MSWKLLGKKTKESAMDGLGPCLFSGCQNFNKIDVKHRKKRGSRKERGSLSLCFLKNIGEFEILRFRKLRRRPRARSKPIAQTQMKEEV